MEDCSTSIFILFGMLRIMGMGDLKLWMFLSTYVGFMDSCVIMVAAAILLILYGWLKNKKETTLIFRHLLISFKTKRKPQVIEQTSYAFAPFILTATLFYLLKGWFYEKSKVGAWRRYLHRICNCHD